MDEGRTPRRGHGNTDERTLEGQFSHVVLAFSLAVVFPFDVSAKSAGDVLFFYVPIFCVVEMTRERPTSVEDYVLNDPPGVFPNCRTIHAFTQSDCHCIISSQAPLGYFDYAPYFHLVHLSLFFTLVYLSLVLQGKPRPPFLWISCFLFKRIEKHQHSFSIS